MERRRSQRELKVLVVDDEVSILKALERLLQRSGYRVFTATTGAEALKLLQCFCDMETGARLGKSSGIEPLRIPR